MVGLVCPQIQPLAFLCSLLGGRRQASAGSRPMLLGPLASNWVRATGGTIRNWRKKESGLFSLSFSAVDSASGSSWYRSASNYARILVIPDAIADFGPWCQCHSPLSLFSQRLGGSDFLPLLILGYLMSLNDKLRESKRFCEARKI